MGNADLLCWNFGNDGFKETPLKHILFLFFIPNIPAFHYSIIPYGSLKKRPQKYCDSNK